MLQACLNGDRAKDFSSAVPCSPDELAREAAAAVAAGAAELHFHPRDAEGRESLAPDDVAAALEAVRAAVPGVPLGLSTHWQIAPGGRARLAPLAAWTAKPDYVSVNLVEPDAPEVIALMLERGVGVEAGLWSPADAERFLALPQADACLRVLVEINEQDLAEALTVAGTILARLDSAALPLPRLLHGLDLTKWPLCREALARGLDTRVGFEDGDLLPDGRPALGNAELVAAAVALAAKPPAPAQDKAGAGSPATGNQPDDGALDPRPPAPVRPGVGHEARRSPRNVDSRGAGPPRS